MDRIDQEHLFATFESLQLAVNTINQEINRISGILKNYEEVKDHDTTIPFNSPWAAVAQIKKLRKDGETVKAEKMCERLVNFLISEVEYSKDYYGVHDSALSPEHAEDFGYKYLAEINASSKLYEKYVNKMKEILGVEFVKPVPEPPAEITDVPPGEPASKPMPEYKTVEELLHEKVVVYFISRIKESLLRSPGTPDFPIPFPEELVEQADERFKEVGISYYSELYNKFLASLPPNLKNKAISLIPGVTKKPEGPEIVKSKISGILSSLQENKYTYVTDGCTYLGVAGIAYASKEYNNFRNACNEEQQKFLDELMADEAVRDYFFKAKNNDQEYDVIEYDEVLTQQAAPVEINLDSDRDDIIESIRFGKFYFHGKLYRRVLPSEGVYDHIDKKCIYFEIRNEHTAICLEKFKPTKKQFDLVMKNSIFVETELTE